MQRTFLLYRTIFQDQTLLPHPEHTYVDVHNLLARATDELEGVNDWWWCEDVNSISAQCNVYRKTDLHINNLVPSELLKEQRSKS